MAETLTMEPNVETTTIENLSKEEQESLALGESMQQAQDNLLAGKYKNAQELEKGYLELQQKLATNDRGTYEQPEAEVEEEVEEGEAQESGNILDDLWAQATSEGDYSEETLASLEEMTPREVAKMHLEYRNKTRNQQQSRDFSEADIQELKGVVGGEANYKNMIQWAQQRLRKQEVQMCDSVMERGDPIAAFFAVRSLAYAYQDSVGYDGNTVQGKAHRQSSYQFRSQAEVVAAMADSRYDTDPAYRNDIMEKLERSPNVNF